MSTSLDFLVTLRSRHAEELRDYLAKVIATADRTPWSRQGTPVRASDIAVPIRIVTEDRTPEKDREEDEQLKKRIDEYKITDPNRARLLEFELSEKERKFARWDQELFVSVRPTPSSMPW